MLQYFTSLEIKRFLPADEGHYQGDRPYSVGEIELLLSKCDIRSRVIILLMTSTGMRIGALSGLRISDVKKMDEFGLYLVYVYNQSKKDRYTHSLLLNVLKRWMIIWSSERDAVKN